MTSISGKTDIDWDAFAKGLADIEVIDEPVLVKKRSRDFFWYSPILNDKLRRCFGDLVVLPKTSDELAQCLAAAYAADVPITVRGGGTGNYGQAVPMDGGLIIEMTAMNKVLEIGEDFVRAEAGALMKDVNAALAPHGREMCMFPSTQDIATIGGFVAGGSSGIGSIANGMLRDPGNLRALKAMSVTDAPELRSFEGTDVLQIHHAWGLNGVITEVSLRTVPLQDWTGCMATFERYEDAYAAGHALAQRSDIGPKLISTVDARITAFFPRLEGKIRADKHLLVSMIPAEAQQSFANLITDHGGEVDLMMSDAERAKAGIPHVYDFSYNHTTLQVLKKDRSATYQQIGCPSPPDPAAVAALREKLSDDVWNHHEFAKVGGKIVTFDLPIIWFKNEEQLRQINQTFEENSFPVYDAHTWQVEGGGLKNADYRHLAWKKRMDPKGLLNSAKSMAWEEVKDLSPEDIEKRGGRMTDQSSDWKVTPLTPTFGAIVEGVAIADVAKGAGFDHLRALFEEHSALLFRNQDITDEDHLALAHRFGPIEDRLADERKPDEAYEVPKVSNVLEDGALTEADSLKMLNLEANFLWHADSTFLPVPALTNILIGRVVTQSGGATELASTRAAWAAMPEALKAQIRGRGIHHKYSHSRAQISPELAKLPMFHKWPDQHWNAVWRNPVNGREALYIASHAFLVDGYSAQESAALLDELMRFCTQPQFTYSHQWQTDDVLIWDQRAVLHRGTPWPSDQPRTLSSLCVSATEADGLPAMRMERSA